MPAKTAISIFPVELTFQANEDEATVLAGGEKVEPVRSQLFAVVVLSQLPVPPIPSPAVEPLASHHQYQSETAFAGGGAQVIKAAAVIRTALESFARGLRMGLGVLP